MTSDVGRMTRKSDFLTKIGTFYSLFKHSGVDVDLCRAPLVNEGALVVDLDVHWALLDEVPDWESTSVVRSDLLLFEVCFYAKIGTFNGL
jgi:hypothetical protein